MTTDTIATMPETLDLAAASVSARKLPAVQIVAYTGGVMHVPQWGLIAIDLAGLELGQVPILADHESRRSGVLGHGQAQVQAGRLIVNGTISATGPAVRDAQAGLVPMNLAGWIGHAPTPSECVLFHREYARLEGMGLLERHNLRGGTRTSHLKLTSAGRWAAEGLLAEETAEAMDIANLDFSAIELPGLAVADDAP